tara:strand:+ start:705 stop:2225 length:1521 start_codon:yes stop_codon:yes gene_type:complete
VAAPKPIDYGVEQEALENPVLNIGRTIGQGLLLGFGDEAEASVRSAFDKSKSYEEFLEEARAGIEQVRNKAPGVAYASEIGASIIGPGKFIQGAKKLKNIGVAGKAAIEGAIYGAGASEGDVGERALSSATGAGLSAGLAKAARKVLPVKSEEAKKLEKIGISPTIGQSFRNTTSIGSNLVAAIEDFSTSYPGVGAVIQRSRLDTLKQTNNVLLNEALQPIGVKLPKGTTGKEAWEFVDSTLNKEYDRVLGKLKLNNVGNIENKLLDIIEDSGISNSSQDYVVNQVVKKISEKVDNNILSGRQLKNVETELGRLEKQFIKKGGFEGEIGEVFRKLKNKFRDEVELQNPNAQELQNINKVYRNIMPINDSMIKALTKEKIFTPNQIIQAIKKGDYTKLKSKTIKGQQPLQETAELAESVVGGPFPDSGTASRLMVGDVLSQPISGLAKLFGPAAVADIAYMKPFGLKPTEALLRAPGSIAARGAAPITQAPIPDDLERKKYLESLLK